MQKTLFHHLVKGYTYKFCEYLHVRYTSKLMIYGFLNFFCVSEGGHPPERANQRFSQRFLSVFASWL
jgi:hypothetical protein